MIKTRVRQRPTVVFDVERMPRRPESVRVRHPGNALSFLSLPAYDVCGSQFGIHHETILAACRIVACNEPGYLSTSRGRASAGVGVDLDSVIPYGTYYYHLDTLPTDPLYPICRNFRSWKFPHNNFPPSWDDGGLAHDKDFLGSHWSTLSQRIKNRDGVCRLSGWKDNLATAHVVPKAEEVWVR